MSTEMLGPIGSIHAGRRPAAISAPPSRGEVKKLRDRLLTYGRDENRALTDAACEFISNAVIAPAYVRAQLNRPNIRPTSTGHLEVVYATVPIDCLIPDPGNGRVAGATAWPAADAEPGQTLKLWSPADLRVHPDSSCEVLVQCDTPREFKLMLEAAADRTKQLNRGMKEKVERDGILDPLLCQLMHVKTIDGHTALAFTTRDGSTRCSFAKEAHRALPHDAMFGPARDSDWRRQRWVEMRQRLELPADQLTWEEMVQLRTFLVDVQIVIGFVPHDPRITVLDAVDDIVRRTHVETSLPWLQVAQDNSQADQVLTAMRGHEVISYDEFLLYGGALTRQERLDRKFPAEADMVFAELLKTLGANASRTQIDKVHAAIRTSTGAGQIRTPFKAMLAGSLGLRQFAVVGNKLQSANTTLEEAMRFEALWDKPWKNTKRSPDELKKEALSELERGGEPGPACRELVIKAAGYLASLGWLKAQISGNLQSGRDQRQPSVVLAAMHETPHGIQVLAEALEAGRRGDEARAISEAGLPIEQASGDVMPLSNEWLRSTFKDSGARDVTTADVPLPTQTPRERVAAHMRRAERLAVDLEHALDAATSELDDDGNPYLERAGWSRAELVSTIDRLARLERRLESIAIRADLAHDLPPAPITQLALVADEDAA